MTKYQGFLWVKTTNGIYKVSGSTWQLTTSGFTVTDGNGCLYSDGTDLYCGGLFIFGSTQALVIKLSGTQWVPIAFTNVLESGVFVSTILKTSNYLHLGGFFNSLGITPTTINPYVPSFASLSNSGLLIQVLPVISPGCQGVVYSLQAIGDSIYVAGGFTEVGNLWTPCTFRFKENGGITPLDGYGFCFLARNYLVYQNELYASGTKRSNFVLVDVGLSKRVGNSWISVSDVIQNTNAISIIFQNKIFVGGKLTGSINGLPSLICSYDGINIVNEGIGVSNPPNPYTYNPSVFCLYGDNSENKLYISGNFRQQDGNVSDGFAVRTFTVLPISLSSFQAKLEPSNTVRLSWRDQTPSEQNSFEVQMSTDSRNFSKIGTVKGTSLLSDYNFTYQLKTCGKYYFRLAFNGKYSEIISVAIVCDIEIYTGDNKSLIINNKYTGNLILSNASGQKVLSCVVQKGRSTVPLQIATGVYIASFMSQDGQSSYTQKVFIK
jgi:hypothetical protein